MFGLGMGEIVVILIVALLFIGPEQLPKAAKMLGKGLRELRKHSRDLQETVESDEVLGGPIRDLRSALRGDEFPPVQPHTWNAPAKPGEAAKGPTIKPAEGTEPQAKAEPAPSPPGDSDKGAG